MKRLFLILPLVIAVVLVGCSKKNEKPTEPTPTTCSISGTVTKASDGTAINGATITTSPGTSNVSTDATGKYTISGVNAGSYTVTASKSGYVDNSVYVSVLAGTTATANISLTVSGTPPSTPATPSPANGATNITQTPMLSWTSSGASSFDVYFGTLSNPPLVNSNQSSPSYSPGILSQNTTYFWKIVAKNAYGSTTGAIWSFTTTSNPSITVTFNSNQSGLSILVDGVSHATPWSTTWVSGSSHTINTTSPQSGGTGIQYIWSTWSDGGTQSHNIAPTSNATYTCNFTKQYYLTMNAGTGGSVSPTSAWFNAGQNVSITATANSGYSFSSWAGSGTGSYSGSNNPASITMNSPISETASFAQNPTNVTVNFATVPSGLSILVDGVSHATPWSTTWGSGSSHTINTTSPQSGGTGIQYIWSTWSDGGTQSHSVSPTSSTTYTCNFTTQYYLTMNAGTGGTVSPSSGWKNAGTPISISATPNSGYVFGSWSGSGTGSYSGTNNPASITMSAPITETASFTPSANPTISFNTNPSGLSVIVDGVSHATPWSTTWVSGSSHTISTTSPQSGGTGIQYIWSSWSDGGTQSHNVSSTSSTTYTCNFTTQYYLTMNASTGGTVSPSSAWYNSGQGVTITATANSGYSFGSWSGSGAGSYSGASNPASITMNAPITETAGFASNPTILFETNPAGLIVSVDGVSHPTPWSTTWISGSSHTISTATQFNGPSTKYVWSSWSDGGALSHTVSPTSNTTYTCNFTTQYWLAMNAGTGGSVSPTSAWYNSGQNVTITASPSSGYTFYRWTGSGTGSYTGSANPSTVTMNGPITETGSFGGTVTLYPIADVAIDEGSPSYAYGYEQLLFSGTGGTATTRTMSLIKFNIGNNSISGVPSGAVITNAQLYLYLFLNGGSIPVEYALAAPSSWNEGTVTWSNTVSSLSWYTVGVYGNYYSGSPAYYRISLINSVSNWYSGTWSNYGSVIRSDRESTTGTRNSYYSREYSTTTYRPKLVITWHP